MSGVQCGFLLRSPFHLRSHLLARDKKTVIPGEARYAFRSRASRDESAFGDRAHSSTKVLRPPRGFSSRTAAFRTACEPNLPLLN
jgi:hypothetical protein